MEIYGSVILSPWIAIQGNEMEGVGHLPKSGPRIVRYFLAAGFLVPCILLAVISLGDVKVQGVWNWILLIPWPTSILLMSAEAGGGTLGQVIAFIIATGANVVVYGILGVVVSFCYRQYRKLRAPRESIH
jgi:hypothetical protein